MAQRTNFASFILILRSLSAEAQICQLEICGGSTRTSLLIRS